MTKTELLALADALRSDWSEVQEEFWSNLLKASASLREYARMLDATDAAYLERNQVVAALAKCFPSGTAKTAIEGWSESWHGCVYIDLPTGQASWHYHESQAYLFEGLPPYLGKWDGHTTPEKYERMARMKYAGMLDAEPIAPVAVSRFSPGYGSAYVEWLGPPPMGKHSLYLYPPAPTTQEPVAWIGPYKSAWDALNELRKSCAEIIGADPETWPNHGNAPLAIAATLAIARTHMEQGTHPPAPSVPLTFIQERAQLDQEWSVLDAMKAAYKPTTPQSASVFGGSYQADGYIISRFTTTAGAERVVFEFNEPKGMLHIFTPEQIEVKP